MDRKFNYKLVRIVCQGQIKSCPFCSDNSETIKEGYCKMCGRPLWKKPGEKCGFILAYVDRNYHQKDKINIVCRNCKTITTI